MYVCDGCASFGCKAKPLDDQGYLQMHYTRCSGARAAQSCLMPLSFIQKQCSADLCQVQGSVPASSPIPVQLRAALLYRRACSTVTQQTLRASRETAKSLRVLAHKKERLAGLVCRWRTAATQQRPSERCTWNLHTGRMTCRWVAVLLATCLSSA